MEKTVKMNSIHGILKFLLDAVLVVFVFLFNKVYMFAVSFITFEQLHEVMISLKDLFGVVAAFLVLLKVGIDLYKTIKKK